MERFALNSRPIAEAMCGTFRSHQKLPNISTSRATIVKSDVLYLKIYASRVVLSTRRDVL